MDQALRALFRPRHLLVTLVVALATGGLGITVTANTGDAGLPPPDPWIGEFATPGPHVGDRGVYKHVGGHSQRDDGYWPDEVAFEWLADTEAFNGTGARVLANQLLLHWINPEPDLLLLEAGTNQELGRVHRDARNESDPGSVLSPGSTSNDTITSMSFQQGRSASLWCGIRTPLQGRSIDLTKRHVDQTDCWNGPHSWATDAYSILVHAVGGQAPQRVAVVDSYMTEDLDRDPTWGGARPFMRSTYQEGFPYALRVEFRAGDSGPDPDGYAAAYELVNASLGVIPVANEPLVVAPAPPPLVLAPRTQSGPDDTGFAHPYPLSASWARASADASYTDLQQYLADHPDAYIGQAVFTEITQDGAPSYHWYVVLTDGQDQFAYRHIHTPGPAALPAAGSPVPVPILQRAGGDSYDRLTNWEDGEYPTPDQLPAHLPTIASLAGAWAAITGRDDANAYGFTLRCHEDGTGCQDVSQVEAGVSRDDEQGLYTPLGGLERRIFSSHLHADASGRLVALSERVTTQEYEDQLDLDEPASDQNERSLPAAQLTTFTPSSSWLPTPTEAAAVGGVALLATLAYWLWPLAKGGGLGLFSRVHKDRLLENPLRQQLVQRIEAEPGIHHNALVRDLGKGKGAAEHHLDKLVDARLVLRHRSPGYTCYFPVGTDRRGMAAAPAVKSDGARQVLEALRNGVPGVRGIAIATGLSPSTVSHHLERLRAAGLVAGDGRSGYHATGSSHGSQAAA